MGVGICYVSEALSDFYDFSTAGHDIALWKVTGTAVDCDFPMVLYHMPNALSISSVFFTSSK